MAIPRYGQFRVDEDADLQDIREARSIAAPAPVVAAPAPVVAAPAPVVAAPAPVVPAPAPVVPAPAPTLDMSGASPAALAWWDSVTAAQNQSLQNAISSGQLPEGFDPSVIYNSLGISPPEPWQIEESYKYNQQQQAEKALTDYFQSQWQSYGIDPTIRGINRAGELANILSYYGITDLSQLGLKTSPYEEFVGSGFGEDGAPVGSLVKGTRGQLTYGDKTYGHLIGIGSKGQQEYRNRSPLEYLQDYGDQGYTFAGSSAGKGAVDFVLLKDAQGNLRKDAQGRPIIVPQWRSTSDAGTIANILAIAAIPFTGGLSSALANAGLGAVGGQIASQALISGGLGGLSAAAQGGDFLSGFGKGALTGGLTAGIGSLVAPAASAVGSSVFDATQNQLLADIASGAVKGGAGALPGALISGDFSNVLTGAVSGGVGSGVGNVLGDVLPDKITDNINVDNALIKGAQGLASAATRAAITGQDINVTGALLPAVAQGIADEYKLPLNQVTAGLQVASKLLQGGDLSPADILRLGTSLSSSATKPTAGQAASAGYGGADAGDFFDSEEAQAVEDDIASILARYPEAESAPTPAPAPYFPEFEEPLLTAEQPAQRVEVAAPALAPTIQDFIDQITREEAVYAIPEAVVPTPAPPPDQRVEVTGDRAPAIPEDFGYEMPPMTEAELQQIVAPPPADQSVEVTGKLPEPLPVEFYETELEPEVLGGMPMDDTQRYTATGKLPEQTFYELPEAPVVQDLYQPPGEVEGPSTIETTGTKLPEQTFYELPEAPVVQDLYQPPGELEGPSTIETTGTKLPETPIIPLEDVPEVTYPEILPQEPIYEQPPTPAPTPPAPSPAPGPAPRPPSPAPAPAAQSPDLSSLLSLLGRGQGAQTTYNPILFQGPAIDLDKLFGYREPPSFDELLAMIGQRPRG